LASAGQGRRQQIEGGREERWKQVRTFCKRDKKSLKKDSIRMKAEQENEGANKNKRKRTYLVDLSARSELRYLGPQ
jgi:hypothetical protein